MIKKLKKDIDKSLNNFAGDLRFFPNIGASPLLHNGIQNFIKRSGKRTRPLLFMISYLGYSKKTRPPYKDLLRASLSLELLHDFLLIHDDIIDNSALRRGEPALHKFFNKQIGTSSNNNLGANLAIIAGDIIFALAINVFSSFKEKPCQKEKALAVFCETAIFTGLGEFMDVLNNIKKIETIKEKDVSLTNILKTAKYTFEGPLVIGALLAGAKKQEIKKLSKLGILLGQAFQIKDDLLDIFSSSKKIGKPILSDLNESKKTLLIWRTYRCLPDKDKKKLKNLLEKHKKTYKDLLLLRKFVKTANSDKYCLNKINSLLAKADNICSKLRMKQKYKQALTRLSLGFGI